MSLTLWRYMDITKFERMLRDSSIYFCSAREFEDKFEAEYAWGLNGHKKFLHHIKTLYKKYGGGMDESYFTMMQLKTLKDLSSRSYVSCWNKEVYESEAMWKLYCNPSKERGLVIKTDLRKLKSVLEHLDRPFKFKSVQYKPSFFMESYDIDIEKMLTYKRKAFAFENEFRVFFIDKQTSEPTKGMALPIDLKNLITEIRLSPYSEPVFKNEVAELLEKYGLCFPIHRSEIEANPIYEIQEDIIENKIFADGTISTKSVIYLKHNH